jgi:hypothetical protein
MNVLGLVFDCKLNWCAQVNRAVIRSNKSLNAIRIIRRYFTTAELNSLLSSNFYSFLFYNLEIWNSSSLHYQCKQILLSASGRALRVSLHYPNPNISFVELHRIAKKATPATMGEHQLALQLYKTFNLMQLELVWDQLNWSQTNATCQINFGDIKNE